MAVNSDENGSPQSPTLETPKNVFLNPTLNWIIIYLIFNLL